MIKKVIHTINKFSLLKKTQNVTIALSGGADSTALFLVLYELGYAVNALHINHGIRGEEAKRDENFCRELCEKHKISLEIKTFNIPEIARENKKGVEETARNIRYECFAENETTATAHTADDNAETVLFNLIRGTGLKGLCGIPPIREGIVRPLIECSRAEVEAFLKHRNQEFVTDSSNLSDDYTRNKIRRNLIPIIKEINPNFPSTLVNMIKALTLENEFIEKSADNAELTKKTDKVLRLRIIERILFEGGYSINSGKINDLDNIFMKTGSIFDGETLKGGR
jgi:tRNA(Ile)-lysidine synthase